MNCWNPDIEDSLETMTRIGQQEKEWKYDTEQTNKNSNIGIKEVIEKNQSES